MLTELKISNFRIVDGEVTVRFRPITILIGRNSSGKSTIIKFLLMLQQSAAPGQLRFLNPEGDKVRLGAFAELKNALTQNSQLSFELSATPNEETSKILAWARPPATIDLELSQQLHKIIATVHYEEADAPDLVSYSLINRSSGDNMLSFDNNATDDSTPWEVVLDIADPTSLMHAENGDGAGVSTLLTSEWMQKMMDVQAELGRRIERKTLIDALIKNLSEIRNLLPVRAEAQRVIVASPPPVADVGQRGEFALPHLQQLMDSSSDDYEFIRSHLENIVDIESMEFKTPTRFISQPYARNRTTGADVLIADYGFGVSQCLPILVQGSIMNPQSTLMVEQPEAQLHPTAQLELGSFFADLWNTRKVATIIETHSDNVLLRIRRLIARRELSHQDVSVAYFTVDETRNNMPTVKNLDINEDGSMEAGLPMEFFGAAIIEGMQLGAKI